MASDRQKPQTCRSICSGGFPEADGCVSPDNESSVIVHGTADKEYAPFIQKIRISQGL